MTLVVASQIATGTITYRAAGNSRSRTAATEPIVVAWPDFFNEYGAFGFEPFTLGPHFASFPSGHATTIGSVAGILILLFPAARYAIIPVALWLAATRAFVGAHHASDILAGLALGFFMTIGAAVFMARMGYVFRQNISGLPRIKKTARILW